MPSKADTRLFCARCQGLDRVARIRSAGGPEGAIIVIIVSRTGIISRANGIYEYKVKRRIYAAFGSNQVQNRLCNTRAYVNINNDNNNNNKV